MAEVSTPATDGETGCLLHFLLVEDDDDHAEILIRTIRRNRVSNSIERVADGVAALHYLRREGEFRDRPRPHVILLDLKLPRKNGHEVLEEIKGDPALRSIPVVVLTTSAAESDRMRAYNLHANSFIVKPVNFSRFRQLVRDLSFYWGVWSVPLGARPGSGTEGAGDGGPGDQSPPD